CSQAEVTMSGPRCALAAGTGSTAGRGRGPTMSTEEATKPTSRAAAKAARAEQLLNVAKTLYARHGFHGVRLDELGQGARLSAPAVYRQFSAKEAVLEELLVGISQYLQSGGDEIVAAAGQTSSSADSDEADAAAATLHRLIDFHVDFAMSEPELI